MRELRNVYRQQVLDAANLEDTILQVVADLRTAGIEPILIKGWSAARNYADPALRPYGDIDLCVAPEQFEAAKKCLTDRTEPSYLIDLHRGVPDLVGRSSEEAFQCSRLVPLGNAEVRILGAEDHLRLLSLHLIRHGAWRPLWLLDVAAAVEAPSPSFNWDYCLSSKTHLRNWIIAVVGLATRLLDARPYHPLPKEWDKEPPNWLVDTVLWRWGRGPYRAPLADYLLNPARALDELMNDGLNPIKASFRLGVLPRSRLWLPGIQLGAWLARAISIPVHLRRAIARRSGIAALGFAVHHEGRF